MARRLRVRKWLNENGHTLKWLAEQTGYAYTTVAHYMSGQFRMTDQAWRKFQAVMDKQNWPANERICK
jgi:hypothetical protein